MRREFVHPLPASWQADKGSVDDEARPRSRTLLLWLSAWPGSEALCQNVQGNVAHTQHPLGMAIVR